MYEFLDKRYAEALYDVAKSKGKVEKYIQDLDDIVKVIDENAELKNVVKHPEISTKEKKKFFISLFKGKIDEDLLTFLLILIEKDRILYLKEKVDEFKKIDLENRNTAIVSVTSAQPLKDYQKEALIGKLSEKYNHRIILDEKVDPEILGGMIIRIGDDLIDASLKTVLADAKSQMITASEGTKK